MKSKLMVVLLTIITAGVLVVVQLRLAQSNPASSQPSALAAAPEANNSWTIECVDCPRWWTELNNRMLRLDSSGRPHIAYVGKGLYYAHFDGTYWITDTIAGAPGGFEATLALDGNNYPHIIYSAIDTNSMIYAFQDASGWHIQDVPGVGFLQGYHASLELDQYDYPHTVYASTGDGMYSLGYSYQDAGGWHSQTVVTTTASIEYTALDLDQYGKPRAVYTVDFPVNELRYAYMVDDEWHGGTIAWGSSWYPSLVLDQSGYPHISYMKVVTPVLSLQYLYQDINGWHNLQVDIGNSIGYYTSLGLDKLGYAHISYADFDNVDLKYAYQDANGWNITVVENNGLTTVDTSMAVDDSGRPHIAFLNGQSLKYALLDGNGWSTQVVDTRGLVGLFSSIALDGNGSPHISYSDELFEQLRYTWRDDSGWHTQAVDKAFPGDTSLDLDVSGYPHISYNDRQQLNYAYQDSTGWYTETVDDAWREAGNSLKLDSADDPHIAYVKPGLMHAYKDASGWHTEFVDTTGSGISLALDGADYGHISYTHNGLEYAYQDASGWYTQTVDKTSAIGNFTSIAVDQAGHPHISYTYYTCPDRVCYTTQLNHAWWDGSGWFTETVDIGDNSLGDYHSIAVDNAGYPHIAYSGILGLEYTYKNATGWHFQYIGSSGFYYADCSLALDKNGFPHISFWDSLDFTLKYAYSQHETQFLPAIMKTLNFHRPRLEMHLDEAPGAAAFLDTSDWGHDASCTAPTCPTAGVRGIHGQALQFDGADDTVTLGNPSGLNFSGNITLEAWVKPQSTTGTQNIIAHGYTNNPDREVFLRLQDGLYKVGSWDGTGYNAYSPIPAGDVGSWVYLAGVYDGSYWKLYRNGMLVNEASQPHGAVQVDDAWAIGSAGNGSERFFSGRIDEAAIYPRALSANEIWLHYQALVP